LHVYELYGNCYISAQKHQIQSGGGFDGTHNEWMWEKGREGVGSGGKKCADPGGKERADWIGRVKIVTYRSIKIDFKPTIGRGDQKMSVVERQEKNPRKIKGACCKPDNIRITTWEMEEMDA